MPLGKSTSTLPMSVDYDLVRNRWDWIALLHTMRPVTYPNGSALHSIG